MTNFNNTVALTTPSSALIFIHKVKFTRGGANDEKTDPRLTLTVSLLDINDDGDLVPFPQVHPKAFHILSFRTEVKTDRESGEPIESEDEAARRFVSRVRSLSMALQLEKSETKGIIKAIEHVATQMQLQLDEGRTLCFVGDKVTTSIGQPRRVQTQNGPQLRTPRFVRCPWIDVFNTSYYLDQANQ